MTTIKSLQEALSEFSSYPYRTYNPGERILFQDEAVTQTIIVNSGILKVYLSDPDGKERTISYLRFHKNNYGLFGVAHGSPLNVSAIVETKVQIVPEAKFLEFLDHHPETSRFLVRYFINIVNMLTDQNIWLKVGTSLKKVAAALYYIAQAIGEEDQQQFTFPFKVTHQEIASLTGLSRETVCADIQQMRQKKIISFSEHSFTIRKAEEFLKLRS